MKARQAIDAWGPGLAGALLVVPLLIWPLATFAVIGALLVAAFPFVTLPEILQSRRWRRRRDLGCCAGCGADLRDEPWKSEGVYDVLRCPVCSGVFHTQQVRFPRPPATDLSPRASA